MKKLLKSLNLDKAFYIAFIAAMCIIGFYITFTADNSILRTALVKLNIIDYKLSHDDIEHYRKILIEVIVDAENQSKGATIYPAGYKLINEGIAGFIKWITTEEHKRNRFYRGLSESDAAKQLIDIYKYVVKNTGSDTEDQQIYCAVIAECCHIMLDNLEKCDQ